MWACSLFFFVCVGFSYADSEDGERLFFSVADLRDKELAYMDVSTDTPYIISLGKMISVHPFGNTMRYYREGTDHFSSVSSDLTKINLKDERDKLLWTIQLYDNKMNVCTDNACSYPYEIKLTNNKITFDQENIALLSQDKNGDVMIVDSETGTYTVKTRYKKLAFLLLAMENMDFDYRLILMSELLKRGY